MILVLGYHEKSAALMARQLRVAKLLDGHLHHKAILSRPSGVEAVELETIARELFDSIEHHVYEDPHAKEPAPWPQPQNWAWQEAARFIADKEGPCWFWWEADVTPIMVGWADTLEAAYLHHGRPFLGAYVHGLGGHMNGVAVYPMCVASHSGNAPFLARDRPFDVVMCRSITKDLVADATKLLFHYPRLNGSACRLTKPGVLRELQRRGYLVIHGVNDASLSSLMLGEPIDPPEPGKLVVTIGRRQLGRRVDAADIFHQQETIRLGQAGWKLAKIDEVRGDIPSFRAQAESAGFTCGIFDLPLTRIMCHFNPTVCRGHDGELVMAYRRWARTSEATGTWQSTLHRCSVNPDTMTIGAPTIMPFGQWKRGHQREDPRLIYHNGGYYLGFVEWQHYSARYIAHQGLLLCDTNWRAIRQYDISFGGNGPSMQVGTRHEKNWLWFYHEHDLYLLYSFAPHTVTRVSGNQHHEVHRTEPSAAIKRWRYGEIRGGSPPILMDGGNQYITFFHSSLWWKGRQKRYYMGAYTFDAKPPFKVRRITRKPILAGSHQESNTLGGPLCIFPGGAVDMGAHWIVVYGVNDEQCGWAKIPKPLVEELLD